MASIEKLGPRCYRVRWREGGRGTPQHSSERFETRRQAEQYAEQIAARAVAHRRPEGLALTGLQLAERWRVHLQSAGRSERYCQMAPDLVSVAIGTLSLATMKVETLRALGLGKRRVIQACLRWGASELKAAIPPACLKLPTGPRAKRPAPDLMPDEVLDRIQVAADAVSAHLGAIVHLVATYGHRPQSLARLRIADHDAGKLRLTVKGGDVVEHPILAETAKRLKDCAGDRPTGERLFLDARTGLPFTDGHGIAMLYRSCIGRSRWKPEPGIYALKRRAISHMLGLNLDPATIASITGHRRPDVLLRHYARTNEERQKAALLALKGKPAREHHGNTGGKQRRRRATSARRKPLQRQRRAT